MDAKIVHCCDNCGHQTISTSMMAYCMHWHRWITPSDPQTCEDWR